MTIPSRWVRVSLWIFAIYTVICVGVYLFQRRIMYFPNADSVTPLKGMEDLTLHSADGTAIKATWWPGSRDVVVVLFHGNAGNRGSRFALMGKLHELGWSVFLLDYRGYGGSDGSPTQAGLGMDGDAAVAWLRENRPNDKLVFFGESIGGSVAIDTATRHKPDALIFQGAALAISSVAQGHYAFLPVGLILKDTWNSKGKIEHIAVPTLCMHGELDRVVPIAHGRALYDAAPGKKEWFEVQGAHHNDLPSTAGARWSETIHAFLQSATR